MEIEFYFNCDCGNEVTYRILTNNRRFNLNFLSGSCFVCENCGKEYYTGDWQDFCYAEE